MSGRFSQDRKEKAAELSPEINERIADYYNVSISQVYDLEGISDGEYSSTDEERGQQILDFAGYDKVVDLTKMVVPVAQRVREDQKRYDVDFAIRTANGRGVPAEYDKILNGWREGGAYPTAYAHGVRSDNDELIEFVLVDVAQFCQSIEDGKLNEDGSSTCDYGTKFVYYTIDSLRRNDCILTEWRV